MKRRVLLQAMAATGATLVLGGVATTPAIAALRQDPPDYSLKFMGEVTKALDYFNALLVSSTDDTQVLRAQNKHSYQFALAAQRAWPNIHATFSTPLSASERPRDILFVVFGPTSALHKINTRAHKTTLQSASLSRTRRVHSALQLLYRVELAAT